MGDTSGNKKGKIETGREKRICMGILAHVDAGKTTLSEGILYLTGSLRKLGRVDHGDAFLDNFALERSRGDHDFFQTGGVSAGRDGSYAYRHAGPCGFFPLRWSGRSG